MAKILKRGFSMEYRILEVSSQKVVESGEYQGNKYTGSVQIKAITIEQVEGEYGLEEKEMIVLFKIPTPDDKLRSFNEWLRKYDFDKEPLHIVGGIPRDSGKDSYQVTSYLNSDEVIQLNTGKAKVS